MLHFITGKGGVGRSTLAAALAKRLSDDGQGPVLLLEIQGSGRSLQLNGLEGPKPFENTALPDLTQAWGSRVMPKEAFRQYFSLILSLGNQQSSFSQATSGIRDRLVDLVVDNPIVSAFVDVCPGLEPVVLLGKIYWETAKGKVPESSEPWRHVVVDAPATGHSLMLFRSTQAVSEVFGSGPIHKQSVEVIESMRDPLRTQVSMVTTPEELPVRETIDMHAELVKLGIKPHTLFVNRCAPLLKGDIQTNPIANEIWEREVQFERESIQEQAGLRESLRTQLPESLRFVELPEIVTDDPKKILLSVAQEIKR